MARAAYAAIAAAMKDCHECGRKIYEWEAEEIEGDVYCPDCSDDGVDDEFGGLVTFVGPYAGEDEFLRFDKPEDNFDG